MQQIRLRITVSFKRLGENLNRFAQFLAQFGQFDVGFARLRIESAASIPRRHRRRYDQNIDG